MEAERGGVGNLDDAGEPELHISSPVLILAGPSPAVSELTQRLRSLDVKVLHAPNGDTARLLITEDKPQLVVVDARASRRVPDLESVVREMRRHLEDAAALVWFDTDVDFPAVAKLCEPVDDHMAARIDVEESLRRLHFLAGRLPERREGERLVVGDLLMDTAARTVQRGEKDIDLSDTEFRLLRLLMRHARTVLPKTEILQQVWEYEFAGQANIVELYISYVRKKIEADMPRMIHTVRGAGYVLRPAETLAEDETQEQVRTDGGSAAATLEGAPESAPQVPGDASRE
ncbi:response regulator transcription factor [Nesterenkonia xinjiangensis]|uniref:Two-component system OmpR family response regulator n=1 Tax=Nesterenkonia xinjiangensis TaxID=225327 RepID=A0A7Z0GMF1_9MICC|nr:two-component system OmpR family response regulator [Nesterenkonia xinjiangensis]